MVLVVGVAIGSAISAALNPAAGVHSNCPFPLAWSCTLQPTQNAVSGSALTCGSFTVTRMVSRFTQPLFVTTTMYCVVLAGVELGFADVLLSKPVAGDHV